MNQKWTAKLSRLSKPVCAGGLSVLMCAGKLGAATTLIYSYDALGRLTFVADPQNGNRDYDYDKAGNRLNVATGTATDGASEPPPPPPPGAPPAPAHLSSQYMNDCNWIAQWSPPGGQTSYQFKETANSVRTLNGSLTSTGVTCSSGNPNSNKPHWIQACNASGCSAQTFF